MTRWGLALVLLLAWPLSAAAPQDVLEKETRSGPVEATVRLRPAAPRIGDSLVLEIEVVALHDVELLMPEFGEALDRFGIADFAPSEHVDDDGRTVSLQRYTLETTRSGVQSVPPILIEFVDRRPGHDPAPEGEDAYELLTERLEFEVASELKEGAAKRLMGPQPELGPRRPPAPPRWPYALAALFVIALAAPFLRRAWLAQRARRRQRSAYEISKARLDGLLYGSRPSDQAQMDRFFVELSGIVRHYLEDRFQLHSPELTTDEFLEVMSGSPDLYRDHQQLLRPFLRRADLVKFAHYLPDASDVEDSIRAARRFLEETRENAPMIDVAYPAGRSAPVASE
ncbi:MAG: hypothetical protein ACE5FL_07255 [Myxococcota bacterium]